MSKHVLSDSGERWMIAESHSLKVKIYLSHVLLTPPLSTQSKWGSSSTHSVPKVCLNTGSPGQTFYLSIRCMLLVRQHNPLLLPADVLDHHPSILSPTELSYFINIPLHLFAPPTLIILCKCADFTCRAAPPGLHFCFTHAVCHSQHRLQSFLCTF